MLLATYARQTLVGSAVIPLVCFVGLSEGCRQRASDLDVSGVAGRPVASADNNFRVHLAPITFTAYPSDYVQLDIAARWDGERCTILMPDQAIREADGRDTPSIAARRKAVGDSRGPLRFLWWPPVSAYWVAVSDHDKPMNVAVDRDVVTDLQFKGDRISFVDPAKPGAIGPWIRGLEEFSLKMVSLSDFTLPPNINKLGGESAQFTLCVKNPVTGGVVGGGRFGIQTYRSGDECRANLSRLAVMEAGYCDAAHLRSSDSEVLSRLDVKQSGWFPYLPKSLESIPFKKS